MKTCNHCSKQKPYESFHKKSDSKDGHQPKCKICVQKINKKFRAEKPEYQIDWQRTNKDKWLGYITDWAKKNVRADNSRSQIYYIINPEQKIYVGSTQTLFTQRQCSHKTQYRDRTASIPGLHHSFDMYGFDNHKWVVMDMAGTDRETLRKIEYTLINHFSKLGMSLNKRLK